MSEHLNVLADIEGRVATLTINRPAKLNALDSETRVQLIEALDEIAGNDRVRVVVITGKGEKAFVAGADITEFEGRSTMDQYAVMKRRRVFETIESLPKPTIAAVNGYCLGGGCELAMACDIRIASDNAKLGQPEVNLGLIPGGGGTQRLPRLVGLGRAYKMLYTGEIIPADEALEIGLVDEVVPRAELYQRVTDLANRIAEKSPVTLRIIKEAVRASTRSPMDEGIKLETDLFGLAFSSEDKKEGIAAFLEKRPPEFKGR